MRTKEEIIKNIFKDLKTAKSLGEIQSVTELSTLEVLIDIRDILNDRLNFIYRLFNKHFNQS